jgi:hypothetical protein
MKKKLDKAATKNGLQNPYLGAYDPVLCKFAIDQLRGKLPGLRKIIYEREESADLVSWVVYCHPPSEDSGASGIVEVLGDLICDLSRPPPTSLPTPTPPSSAYSMKRRFDLILQSQSEVSPAMLDKWLEAIRDHPLFLNIYQSINLSVLPVTLSDLAALYGRQIEQGHTERICTIIAPSSLPGDIANFITLAKLASTSLTSLILADQYPQEPPELGFHDLPNLVSAITTNLPNLTTLHIALRDVLSAENVCRNLLSPEGLDKSGHISSIILFTASYPNPLFNTKRYLAPLCVRHIAPIITGDLSSLESKYWEDHTAWLATLKYLRS